MATNSHPLIRRIRFVSALTLSLAVLLGVFSSAAMAQTKSSKPEATEAKIPRKNPFGTQVAPNKAVPILQEVENPEPASDILKRTGSAHNIQKVALADMVAEGTVTIYTAGGPTAFGVTLIQSGEHGSQQILLKQPDGKLWDGRVDHLAPGGGQALVFLETQYRRGLQQLLASAKRDAKVADNGIRKASRVVTVMEKNGDSTKYLLDPATSRMTRFEFVRGQSRDSVGNVTPIVHSYAFADVRSADSVATPFHIEHSVDGVKQEELQFTKVRYHSPANSAPAARPTARR